jgi:hypothetical protein
MLAHCFPVQRDCISAARWSTRAFAQTLCIQFEFVDSAAQGVTVHTQLACGLALVSFAVLQYRKNESLLEFTYAFGIGYAVLVHLRNQRFQLIFHNASLCIAHNIR